MEYLYEKQRMKYRSDYTSQRNDFLNPVPGGNNNPELEEYLKSTPIENYSLEEMLKLIKENNTNENKNYMTPTTELIHNILHKILNDDDKLPYNTSPKEHINKNTKIKEELIKYLLEKGRYSSESLLIQYINRIMTNPIIGFSQENIDRTIYNL